MGFPSIDLFASRVSHQIHPIQPGEGCLSDKVGQGSNVYLSTILPHRKSTSKICERSNNIISDSSLVANTRLVSNNSSTECKESNITARSKKYSNQSQRPSSSSYNAGIPKVSGMACLRTSLQAELISEKAAILISSARREGTNAHYESAWRKYASWCGQRNVDPTRCVLKWVLDFLAELFDSGLEFNTIAGYRAAISAYHEHCEGFKVGEHPRVSNLMLGIFNKRPPKPRYNFIWDIDIVLRYFLTLKTGF